MYTLEHSSNIHQLPFSESVKQGSAAESLLDITGFDETKIVSFQQLKNKQKAQGGKVKPKSNLADSAQSCSVTLLSPNENNRGKQLATALQRPLAQGQCRAIFIWRLVDYRDLKELFGNQVAEALQHRVAERLQHCLSMDDVIEQIAEDEFGVVINSANPVHKMSTIAQRLIEKCSGVYALEDECLHINALLGIACYDTDSRDPEELIRFARLAIRQRDDQSATPYHFFSKDHFDKQKHHLRMIVEMEQAIEQDRLLLHYQPQYDMNNNKQVIGLEALIRMADEDGKLIPPDHFIPLAEDNGMIIAIGRWVVREACQQLKRWHDDGHTHLRMAINVSPKQLVDVHLTELITQAVIENGLNYYDLELEITEQCLMENTAIAEQVLHTLSQKGVRIALDDFGTGYSSLAYLARFPLNVMKLDRSFLAKAPEDARSKQIISAILAMAEKLELEVVAEGIETDEQHQFLSDAGCPIGQGYGFSRPKLARELQSILNSK